MNWLPHLNYNEQSDIWANLIYHGINEENEHFWKLKSYGTNIINQNNVNFGDVSSELYISLSPLDYKETKIWANLEYFEKNVDNELIWKLINHGQVQ